MDHDRVWFKWQIVMGSILQFEFVIFLNDGGWSHFTIYLQLQSAMFHEQLTSVYSDCVVKYYLYFVVLSVCCPVVVIKIAKK